ncbi:SDR family oxidoreductase [Pseudomonas nicosulfuronedens]|uniref:SDR family oxidoreductase n=1 Tax=Pseudomonas nicosulfuronedens TaxID=2571105 RepID=A0A5R9QNQ9_9PSED|nr:MULTISPECIES: glucose 1-dehydrogenase [Pseudomonas]TLX71339.1 SDR family oxidoreductase [Pseudomonas nicosulfuronedens]
MQLFSLQGKVALVTGASRGLGRSMALGLAAAGATVVLAARDRQRLLEVAEEIRQQGGAADIQAFDLADEGAVIAAIPDIVNRHGRLDVLLNNAGICLWQPLLESSLDDWRKTLDINLTANYLLAREAARPMLRQGSGSIINVGSYVARVGREKLQAYVASKHGVVGLTKSLAGELGQHGVRCNAICPGYFQTDMAEPVAANPALWECVRSHISLGRWGDPEELQGAAIFLASNASSYVNGHALMVDGGVSEVLCLPIPVA